MKHEPLSWLVLERYALGELSPSERADVERRLAESEVDRACLAQIQNDTSALPPLAARGPSGGANAPERAPPGAVAADGAKVHKLPRRGGWIVASSGLCAAAAVALLLFGPRRQSEDPEPTRPGQAALDDNVKGSDVTVRLTGERQGAEPKHFGLGERFKVEVTCPPRLSSSLRLFVFQGDEVFEPLPTPTPLACGNLVPWPGAFALDGDETAEICVTWSARTGAISAKEELGSELSCVQLAPGAP
jgi:hypothetical protein